MTALKRIRMAFASDVPSLAQQKAEDAAREVALEEAAAALSFDDLTDALAALPARDKADVLREAAQHNQTLSLAEIYERLLDQKTQDLLQRALW